MIIDNRCVLPMGTYLFDRDGEEQLAVYMRDKTNVVRYLPMMGRVMGKGLIASVPDVSLFPEPTESPDTRTPKRFIDLIISNRETNKWVARKLEFSKKDKVILVGAGLNITQKQINFIEAARDEYVIVTIGNAFRKISPDYHVVVDPFGQTLKNLDGFDFSNTIAFIGLCARPGVEGCGWKDIGWFDSMNDSDNDLPKYRPSYGVATSALDFIFNELKASKVVMVGIEHPWPVYFWIGTFFQAWCYFHSNAKKEIWNCSNGTSSLAGVILGSIEEALKNHGPGNN